MKFVEGGVCAAKGFRAAGIHVGVKTHADWKKDVALIVSETPCAAAGVFTRNVVKAAPVHVDLAHLKNGVARAVIANSGNANACAPHGEAYAERMCAAAANVIGCAPEDVLVSSTGVIGQTLNIEAIEGGVQKLYDALESSPEASDAAAHAIMTTDTAKKRGRRGNRYRRENCPYGRNRQGKRHDSPQHGDNVVLPYNRLRHIL